MEVHHIAAFSDAGAGGNPAGVVLLETPAPEGEMQKVAAEVGYSETAFAVPVAGEDRRWRVRYFSPEAEAPFCGHATIALGAVLGQQKGTGTYKLDLNTASITVEAETSQDGMAATLASPATKSRAIADEEAADAMALLGLSQDDLDPRLPPAHIHAGANHLVFALHDRSRLAAMSYDLDEGRDMMRQHELVTIMLVYVQADRVFAVRNAFASGGVLEDPATGAAAAAFAGYLRDHGWPHGGSFTIIQGEDMGALSIIEARLSDEPGSPVRLSGQARAIWTQSG
tara:strand:- start:18080 stop:18931 length:852 start_codon:yes stop_codon:yes gene_type:complete